MPSELERRAASLLCVGFHGTEPSAELDELLRRGVRSVILFKRNLGEPAGVFELTRALKQSVREPLCVAIDQEGGQVQRLRRGFTELPPMRALGRSRDPALARDVGLLLGRELRAVGVDWNFAPVLDVDTNPQNPVIGARALSHDPALVAQLGLELARGLTQAGVAACAKHFPGHGDTELDSHVALPRLRAPLERLQRVELLPFRAAAQAGIESIMTAHVVFEALDPALPATLSPRIISQILRVDCGYAGLVVSDDLEMQAIIANFGVGEAVVLGLRAGVDAFLVCHSAERMHEAIDSVVHAVEGGALSLELVEAAASRHSAFAQRFAAPPRKSPDFSGLRSASHLALAERLRRFAEANGANSDPTESR